VSLSHHHHHLSREIQLEEREKEISKESLSLSLSLLPTFLMTIITDDYRTDMLSEKGHKNSSKTHLRYLCEVGEKVRLAKKFGRNVFVTLGFGRNDASGYVYSAEHISAETFKASMNFSQPKSSAEIFQQTLN
jgi:hypothetical protein